MTVQIEMSAAQWHSLLGYLEPNTSAFATVKDAIEQNEAPITTPLARVGLLLNDNEAEEMLRAAEQFFPEAAERIKAALDHRNYRWS